MRTLVRMLLLVVVVGLLAAPASLAAGEKNHFRFHLGYMSPTGDNKFTDDITDVDFDGDGTPDTLNLAAKAEFQGALGAGIGYEYMVTDLIGIDAGLDYFKPDLELTATGTLIHSDGSADETVSVKVKGSGKFMPLTVGPMFHVAKNESMDFYLGPQLAYIMYGDVSVTNEFLGEVKAKFKNELTWGVKLGIDVPLGQGWAFNGQLQYLDAKSELDEDISPKPKFNAKPFILTAGATYRF